MIHLFCGTQTELSKMGNFPKYKSKNFRRDGIVVKTVTFSLLLNRPVRMKKDVLILYPEGPGWWNRIKCIHIQDKCRILTATDRNGHGFISFEAVTRDTGTGENHELLKRNSLHGLPGSLWEVCTTGYTIPKGNFYGRRL